MFEQFLIAVFGKTFFKWQGRQEIKKQELFKQLDVLVGEDSVDQITREIRQLESDIDAERYGGKELKDLTSSCPAELARHYKPDREAYLSAVELLSLKPEEVMMAAAHRSDLEAARSFGLRTGFIHRPTEYGPARSGDIAKPGEFDVVASDILDLAAKMGA